LGPQLLVVVSISHRRCCSGCGDLRDRTTFLPTGIGGPTNTREDRPTNQPRNHEGHRPLRPAWASCRWRRVELGSAQPARIVCPERHRVKAQLAGRASTRGRTERENRSCAPRIGFVWVRLTSAPASLIVSVLGSST